MGGHCVEPGRAHWGGEYRTFWEGVVDKSLLGGGVFINFHFTCCMRDESILFTYFRKFVSNNLIKHVGKKCGQEMFPIILYLLF